MCLVASLTLAPKKETKLQKKVNLEVIKAIVASPLSPLLIQFTKNLDAYIIKLLEIINKIIKDIVLMRRLSPYISLQWNNKVA